MFKKLKFIKILLALSTLLLFGCSVVNKTDNPLVIPPRFNEIPNLNHREPREPKTKDQNIEDLKNLLLENSS
jgi:hypothetical protein